MRDEKKKQKQDNKIISFEMRDEILMDPHIDQMIKESLIHEADELEAELKQESQQQPADECTAEDMLASIVGKLKERGIWEEESDDGDGADAREEELKEQKAESGTKVPQSPESSNETVSLEQLYAMLPEADRRALEMGRRVEQKNRKREGGRLRRKKMLRSGRIATAALVLLLLFGFGMTGEASRRLVNKVWDFMALNFNFHVQMDYTGEEEQTRSVSREETAAMEEISDRLDIPPVSLEVLPGGMEYSDYQINMDDMNAMLVYAYKDTLFSVIMVKLSAEGSSYYMVDELTELLETITTEQELEAKIWETNQTLPEENRAYIAKIEYNDCQYIFNGMLSLEEMEKIVKHSYIL